MIRDTNTRKWSGRNTEGVIWWRVWVIWGYWPHIIKNIKTTLHVPYKFIIFHVHGTIVISRWHLSIALSVRLDGLGEWCESGEGASWTSKMPFMWKIISITVFFRKILVIVEQNKALVVSIEGFNICDWITSLSPAPSHFTHSLRIYISVW